MKEQKCNQSFLKLKFLHFEHGAGLNIWWKFEEEPFCFIENAKLHLTNKQEQIYYLILVKLMNNAIDLYNRGAFQQELLKVHVETQIITWLKLYPSLVTESPLSMTDEINWWFQYLKCSVSARPPHCGNPALQSEKAPRKTEKGPI